MQLAGRLRLTTLGDVLGALYRGHATGVLELTECAGSTAGRTHRIHLCQGLVREIESSISTGTRTIDARARFDVPADLRAEQCARLEALFGLTDARLAFRVASARRLDGRGEPLEPTHFLHGRPRLRDRFREDGPQRRRDPVRTRALRTLGLPENADATACSQAFRKLASRMHPDRFPGASERERAELMRRFAELSAAYHVLVA